MKRLLLTCLLAGLASAASAQTAVGVSVGNNGQPANAAANKLFCVRETGTRIHQIRAEQGTRAARAADCATVFGRSYDRTDIERTGEVDLAQALRKLDPSIH